MQTTSLLPSEEIASFVKAIIVFDNEEPGLNTTLPFFADGCPGIMYQVAPEGLYVKPQNKKMPSFFLYGQTIQPIELSFTGRYHFVVFQLYPFAVKTLLGIDPKTITDDCFDLSMLPGFNTTATINQLHNCSQPATEIEIISAFLSAVAHAKTPTIDDKIQHSINLILRKKGSITVKEVRERLHITERTFERQFLSAVGVSPKQFIKIIQFQTSLTQLTEGDYSKLTDIVFENGFADQSHFIRTFKKYTGKTPFKFQADQD